MDSWMPNTPAPGIGCAAASFPLVITTNRVVVIRVLRVAVADGEYPERAMADSIRVTVTSIRAPISSASTDCGGRGVDTPSLGR